MAPHRYRFWLVPGVRTCFCVPRFIQSGPILGFRCTSTSSRYTAAWPAGGFSTTARMAARRSSLSRRGQGQFTRGRGRPRRALFNFNARLIVAGCTPVPVSSRISLASSSRVQVGRG